MVNIRPLQSVSTDNLTYQALENHLGSFVTKQKVLIIIYYYMFIHQAASNLQVKVKLSVSLISGYSYPN